MGVRIRPYFLIAIVACVAVSCPAFAGRNLQHKIAVHVVPHASGCGSLPTFTDCSQIVTSYTSTGDIDVIPVFFDLTEYLVVEFGLIWPSEWGSMEYTRCVGDLAIGQILHPGDGIATCWSECQNQWAVSHGFGWLTATGPGTVTAVPNPATGDYGAVDCQPLDVREYDPPAAVFAAGVGGPQGEDPCRVVHLPPAVTISDGLDGQCASVNGAITYTIRYDNSTNNTQVTGVVLVDRLPQALEFVSSSPGGVYDSLSQSVTWTLGDLQPGEADSQEVVARVSTSAGSSVTNSCEIACSESRTAAAGCTTDICEAVFRPIQLRVSVAADTCLDFGDSLTYTISYTNINPLDVHNVVLEDRFPQQTELVWASSGGVLNAGKITWNLGTLAAEASGSQQLGVRFQTATGYAAHNWCEIACAETDVSVVGTDVNECGAARPRNWDHWLALHVRAHDSSCKSIPAFLECTDILTTYEGCGDIDVIPVFFDLAEITVAEFGLQWPAEWGTCSFTRCGGDLALGGITNPGDGIAIAWSQCRQGGSLTPGFGWLQPSGPGMISACPNPATGDIGVVNCAPSPGPYYDRPVRIYRAGVCGTAGDRIECGGPQAVKPTTWGAIKAMFK